jgi:hypothetical protein
MSRCGKTPIIMRISRKVLLVLGAFLLVVSCRKEEETAGVPAAVPAASANPLHAYFNKRVAAARQNFNVNASVGGTITGNDGCRVTFAPQAFRTAAGAMVNGTVQVELVEVLDYRTMIRLNKQTVGRMGNERRMLGSGGELRVIARQYGVEVDIARNAATVSVPTGQPDSRMQVFYGDEAADGSVEWEFTEDTLVVPDTADWDSAWGDWFYYTFQADSLGWLNCDYFPQASLSAVSIAAPAGFTQANTLFWVAIPAMNGVMSCWYTGTVFQSAMAPIGMPAVMIGLHQDADGNHQSSFTDITIAPGATVTPVFTPTTLSQFESDINGI